MRIDARAEVPAVQVHQVCDHVQRRCAADHQLRVPEHACTWGPWVPALVRACVREYPMKWPLVMSCFDQLLLTVGPIFICLT